MREPKVSIIVPVYKTEKYLMRCLDSLRQQTLKDIEIILVDDGSPDHCPALCDRAAEEDARIRVVHKANAGLGMARNSGLDAASGKYVGFVDSDDYVDTRMYEALYAAAEKHQAQLVLSGLCFVGGNMFEENDVYTAKVYFKQETLFDTPEACRKLMLGIVGALPKEPDDSRYGASVCKNLFRRDFLEAGHIRFQSEREILSEDTLFMLDTISGIACAVGVPGAYYCYCRNGESLSKAYRPARYEMSLVFLKELESRLQRSMPEEEYQLYLDRLTQAFARILCSQEIVHAHETQLSSDLLRQRLKEICTRKEYAEVLKRYPWYRLPFKQAAFAFAMRYRLYWMQELLVRLRNGG